MNYGKACNDEGRSGLAVEAATAYSGPITTATSGMVVEL